MPDACAAPEALFITRHFERVDNGTPFNFVKRKNNRNSETQHPKPCWCKNALGFTRILVILGFLRHSKVICSMRLLVYLRSTQPTR